MKKLFLLLMSFVVAVPVNESAWNVDEEKLQDEVEEQVEAKDMALEEVEEQVEAEDMVIEEFEDEFAARKEAAENLKEQLDAVDSKKGMDIHADGIEEEAKTNGKEVLVEEKAVHAETTTIESTSEDGDEKYVLATDADFSGSSNGNFRYIGNAEYVEIPHVIKGVPVTSYHRMFAGTSVKGVKSTNKNVTDMSYMFNNIKTTELDLSSFDTSNVTNMRSMFSDARSLTKLDLSSFDTSNVTDMSWMFDGARSLTELDLSSFDTSNVTDMGYMFSGASSLTELDLSSFDTSKVLRMDGMFHGARSLTELDLSNFDTSNVTDMSFMFYDASSLTELDLSSFDTSNVTDMRYMFSDASSLRKLDLSSFDTSNVTNMSWMFYNARSLTKLDLSSFDTSNVTDMNSMFRDASGLTELDLSSFDTSNVMNMSFMFYGASSLTELDLSSFDTSNVTNMSLMFSDANSLTELDLSSFDTSNVTDMSWMFSGTSSLTELDLSSFDMSNVENTYGMFDGTSATIGYARTQEDADILNATELKPEYLIFIVKKAPKEILNLFTPEIDDFGDVFITNKRQFVSTEIAPVIVEDWRETSNNWSLSISASPLRQTDDAFELPEGTLSLKGVSHIEKLNGDGVLPMKRLTGKTAIDESKVVLVEGKNSKGEFEISFEDGALEMVIDPGIVRKGEYETTITWELAAVPFEGSD